MDELLSEFLAESLENLAVLDVALVELEQAPDDSALVGRIFRILHTIKGTCGFLRLPRVERLAHAAEHVLGRIRDGEIAATPAAVSALLRVLDRIRLVLDRVEATRAEPSGDDRPLLDLLSRIAAGAVPSSPEVAAEDERLATAERVGGPAACRSPRVPADRLDNLMTLVSELVLTRDQLLQMVENERPSPFDAPVQRLSRITAELHEGLVRTRLQPIGNAWSTLPRLVRDLARVLDKKIALEMRGADTEVDRRVLELVKDPLTHIIRNAADHGIEGPGERRRAGKPEHGTILLRARHEGGWVVIDIADDGRGLDPDEIGEQAREQGFATVDELAVMRPREVLNLTFEAGFSTARRVTSVSGRGVGMDVVRTNIEKIGGRVAVSSAKGRGTRLQIKCPSTLEHSLPR